AALLPAAGDDRPDPVKINRVVLPAARLEEELKRLDLGGFRRLPRDEFEARVEKAHRRQPRPRLVEARYRATLTQNGFQGSLRWRVRAEEAPLWLDVTGLGLALDKPRWEDREALVLEAPGRGTGVLIDQAGDGTLTAGWSSRVETRPEGLQADLRFPPCP